MGEEQLYEGGIVVGGGMENCFRDEIDLPKTNEGGC
jgi:hypothetical protein